MQVVRFCGYGFAGLAAWVCACATTAAEKPSPPLVGEAPTPMQVSDLPAEPPQVAPAPVEPAPPPVRTCQMFSAPSVLRRAALGQLLDAGLARWLQGVEGDRVLANHRFQGWLIKSLHPGDPCYEAIDLRNGDIVQKVNGKSIEKPEQAFDVAQSLRNAPALTVDFIRDGKAQKLSLLIANE